MKTTNYNIINFAWLCFFSLLLCSCDSFVDTELPDNQLTSGNVFENYATANAALTDIYAKIRDKGLLTGSSNGISTELGNYTDELVSYGNPANPGYSFYNNILLASNPVVLDYWNTSYNQVYAANSIIEGADKSFGLSVENKNQLEGEALFIRALVHFYLVNLYGKIPYIKETDYKKNSIVSRMPVEEVYENIVSDLEKAVELLPENYSSQERVRPNKNAAKAFLSRTYLYSGAFAQAANTASSLLNQDNLYSLMQDPNEVFLINSKETIWQLQSAASGQNTLQGGTFIFTAGPPSLSALNQDLVNSFDLSDLRLADWIKTVAGTNQSWSHSYKYKEQNNTPVSKEYSIIFRLAEQYLIRSEARVRQGDLIGAKEDLNKIRNRAGLPNTDAQSAEQILQAILQERRWELFTEYGHRFFDLKRFNMIDLILSGIKSGWNTSDSLFPIPQSELSANPNLRPQNQGY